LTPLRTAAPSGWISGADGLQGGFTEPLGIALTGFRKCDNALRKRGTNGIVKIGGSRSEANASYQQKGSKRASRHIAASSLRSNSNYFLLETSRYSN
jgi:hypothetical protein